MRTLDQLLSLGEESRVTGVMLTAASREITGTSGTILMNVATGTTAPSAVGGPAVSQYMNGCLGIIGGIQGNGANWFATFEHSGSPNTASLQETSRSGVDRAFDLTGLGAARMRTVGFDWDDLEELYLEAGCPDVAGWSIVDLLLGTVVNLWHGDLRGVFDELTAGGSVAGDSRSLRAQIDEALRRWSATHDNPGMR